MTTLLSLLLVAVGLIVLINTIRATGTRPLEFPRYHATVPSGRRFLSVLLGVIITLCGGGMFVFSRLD